MIPKQQQREEKGWFDITLGQRHFVLTNDIKNISLFSLYKSCTLQHCHCMERNADGNCWKERILFSSFRSRGGESINAVCLPKLKHLDLTEYGKIYIQVISILSNMTVHAWYSCNLWTANNNPHWLTICIEDGGRIYLGLWESIRRRHFQCLTSLLAKGQPASRQES